MQALGLTWGDHQGIHETYLERTQPVHPGARQLLAVWAAQGGRLVVGRDLPSRELARVLGGLVLYEPLADGDFRVRLAGLQARRRFGRDITGETLSAVLGPEQFHLHSARMRVLMATGAPLIVEVQLSEYRVTRCYFEVVALRIFAPDGMTPWVMSGIFFHDWRL